MRAVLSFIAPETSGASIKVLEDNQGAKALTENPLSSARSKHIDVRYHFIRDLFRTRNISVEYVALRPSSTPTYSPRPSVGQISCTTVSI